MEVLDSIQDVIMVSMKPSSATVITQRQRVFYHICALVLCLLCTIVPLDSTDTFRAVTMFHTPKTLMHIGLQPIVLAATICEWCSIKHKPIIALLCTLPYLWGHTWTHAIILLVFSWGLIHLYVWLTWNGVLPINVTLCTWWACTQYCLHPIAWICVGIYAYLRLCTHNFPVVFTKRQIQPQAAKMSVLLHRSGPLLFFVRCVEFLGCLLPDVAATISAPTTILEFLQAVLISSVCLYGLQRRWPSWFKQTGHQIVKGWKEKHFTIKGWHSVQTAGKHVNKVIQKHIHYSAVVFCSMSAACAMFSVRLGALCMVFSAFERLNIAQLVQQTRTK